MYLIYSSDVKKKKKNFNGTEKTTSVNHNVYYIYNLILFAPAESYRAFSCSCGWPCPA